MRLGNVTLFFLLGEVKSCFGSFEGGIVRACFLLLSECLNALEAGEDFDGTVGLSAPAL